MSASRKVSVWLLIILLPVAVFVGWRNYHYLTEERETAEPPANPNWKFASEEHWLVDETARNITEMLAFAASGKTDGVEFTATPQKGMPESFDLRAKVNGKEVKAHLEWKDFIWSPAEYTPWAQQLVTTLQLTPPAPAPGGNEILQTLTSPTPDVLLREATRLSDALTKAPLDAALHEQAALVTAAFALREVAGMYTDLRREICRVAAHLTVAETLQPKSSSPVRKMAEAALHTLTERQTAALVVLGELEHDSTPGVAAWVRALRARNTADWRNVPADATLLEQIENFLARTRSVDAEFAIQWLAKGKPAEVDAWRRIILQGNYGVERGHQFAKDSMGHEIYSLQTDWSAFFGGKLAENDIVKALNEPPARSVGKRADGKEGMNVLGWDLWSAQHQRHLCAAIEETIHFLRDLWSVPEYREAQQFIRKNLGGITLMPTVERELTEDQKEVAGINKRMSALLAEHPERVAPSVWADLQHPGKKVAALNIVAPQGWVHPSLPFGTTYNICSRAGCLRLPGKGDTAWWNRTLQIAPATFHVLSSHLWAQYGDHPPVETVETTYAPLADYSLGALRQVAWAQKDKSPKYIDTLKKICEFDADRYFDLAAHYVKNKQPEQAAEAYQKGVDVCPDRVLVANSCDWLVNYLDDHGQPEKALAIAKEAAEVYSYRGLETMGRFEEKHGHLKEAEDCFKKINERYENPEAMEAFYVRCQDKDPAYKAAASRALGKLFPNGLEKVALKDFQEPPPDGTRLTSNSSLATALGLQLGDVLVSIDGYRVHTMKQYLFVRSLSNDPKFPLIFWNPKGYHEVEAVIPGRRLSVDLADYHKR